jgi:excisionase family DNA binding protein
VAICNQKDGTFSMDIKTDTFHAFDIKSFCALYSIGRSTVYKEIAAGRLAIRKVGKRTLIPADAAEAWFASLPQDLTR